MARGPTQPRHVLSGDTAARYLAEFGGYLQPGTSIPDAGGRYAALTDPDLAYYPGLLDNLRGGNYGIAAAQAAGLLGDALYTGGGYLAATGAGAPAGGLLMGMGAIAKSPRAAQKTGEAMKVAKAAGKAATTARAARGGGRTGRSGRSAAAADPVLSQPLTGAMAPETPPVRGQTSRELRAAQEAQLTPREMERLQEKAQIPAVARAIRFMHPDEARIFARSGNPEQLARLLEDLPRASEMASVMRAGAPKQGWYRTSAQALIDVFGPEDAVRFSSLLAATSPQNSVEMNLLNTLNIWKNWKAAGSPTDPRQIKAIMGASVQGARGEQSVLDAWVNNSIRALSTADPRQITLSGPKVDSFFRNLNDDVFRVTNDAWMANAAGVQQTLFSGSPTALQLSQGNPGVRPGYLAANVRARDAAQQAGMFPSEGQETMWSYAMPLLEDARNMGIRSQELLDRGLLTPDRIRQTPDFATLLRNDPTYHRILDEAGYGQQVAGLQTIPWGREVPLTATDQRNVDALAARLDRLRDLREADKARGHVYFRQPGRDTLIATETAEAIPGLGVGHVEGLINAPWNVRQDYTTGVLGAFDSPRGTDILHEALGMQATSSAPMTGAWRPAPGLLEVNPGRAFGVTVDRARASPEYGLISAEDGQKLTAAATLRGSMTGQLGSPYNVRVPDPDGTHAFLPLDKTPGPDRMRDMLRALPEGVDVADTGAGLQFLNWNEGGLLAQPGTVGPTRMQQVEGLVGADLGAAIPARGQAERTYMDLSPFWQQGEGSGAVVENLFRQLRPTKQRDFVNRLDTPDLRRAAGDIYERNVWAEQRTGTPARQDVQNMLQIIRDQGLAGLEKVSKSPYAWLPTLAGVGLLPLMLEAFEEEGVSVPGS